MSNTLRLAVSIFLVSCASLNQIPEHAIKGAKLRPPGEFRSLKHNSKELRMGFRTNGEKWAIEAWVVSIPYLPASAMEFKDNVKKNEVIFLEKETYEVLDYEIKDFKSKGEFAFLSKWKAKDKTADSKGTYISGFELSCLHPTKKTLGYNVLISRRSGSNQPDSAFDNLAMTVMESFKFVDP